MGLSAPVHVAKPSSYDDALVLHCIPRTPTVTD